MLEIINRNSPSEQVGDQISIGGYIFDAYLRISHDRKITVTQHPVETGAAITDHAYVEPATFELDIGMTDTTLGRVLYQFGTQGSYKTRSVRAYDVLVDMQESRIPYELICRYGSFNVVIEDINPTDDYTTRFGLRASVRLREILTTSASSVPLSADPYVTQSINRGTQNSVPVDRSAISQLTGKQYQEGKEL